MKNIQSGMSGSFLGSHLLFLFAPKLALWNKPAVPKNDLKKMGEQNDDLFLLPP